MVAAVPDLDGPQSHSERLKIEYAPVMQGLYRAMKRFCTPGIRSGIAELGVLLERSECSLRNQFGPTCYDHAPTVHAFLQIIEALQSREAVHEVAALADCATIPRAIKRDAVGAPAADLEAFAELPTRAAAKLDGTISRLTSGVRLTADERTAARDALFDIVAYAAHLINRVR